MADLNSIVFKEVDQQASERSEQQTRLKAEQEVEFAVIFPKAKPGAYGSKEDPSPYVHLADPKDDIANMLEPDEIVIHKKKIRIKFDYPIDSEPVFLLEAPAGSAGFSRAQLAYTVSKIYQYIYEDEDKSSQTIQKNPGLPNLVNRGTSDGRYGIWGHSLGDLDLGSVSYNPAEDLYSLSVDS